MQRDIKRPRNYQERQVIERRMLPVLRDPGPSALALELSRHVRGEVRFDDGSRALYATDASNYRQVPIGVVVPRELEDVTTTIAIARAFGAPIVARGGGTSLAGQACNAAVVLDFSKYVHRILELDPYRRIAIVEPGLVLDDLRREAEAFELTFGPDPSTHDHCTLGGMIGNNSCGVHSMMAGCTADNVVELEIQTYDGARFTVGTTSDAELMSIIEAGGRRGEIYRGMRELRDRHADAIRRGFPPIPRRVSGYNLPSLLPERGFDVARLLVGSEGTLATVLRATVRLVPSPPARTLVVVGYPSVFEAADHITLVREHDPIGLEGIDDVLVEDMKRKHLHPDRVQLLPDGEGWLLVELGGETGEESEARAQALCSRLRGISQPPAIEIIRDAGTAKILWAVRESGLGATARVPGEHDTWEGWEDAAVAPEQLGDYLRGFRALLERFGFHAALYGHFGQGCVHTRIPFDLRSAGGIAKFRGFVEEAADLVVAHGGSLSGEHGDGQSRAELLPKMFGPEIVRAFEELKAIWDPQDRMNPGKVVHPYRLDENLRLGGGYAPREAPTHFRFPDDHGSLSYAVERCVGVGTCRRLDGGTMCPSYMVTREEMHSTRGRAHLLFEMMRGDATLGGWQSEAVHEALDLCLSCKGCKSECPVNVDLATYKAEFLSHYYEHRLRPRSAYAFGLIYWWARLGSLVPELVNRLMRAPIVSSLLKWIAGVDPRRSLPQFAPVTFAQWWRRRPPRTSPARPKVVLWVDTFNNHWHPDVAIAAVGVLEGAGFEVVVPRASVCCGRPLYDYGMLRLARRMLERVLDVLRPAIRAGIPIVGLEPSCIAVFRDELVNLFPDDDDARRLHAQSFMLGDFMLHHVPDWRPPRIEGTALVQGHCHDKAVLGFEHDKAVFAQLGLDADVLDAGCCGMAGGFGFERGHYAVSAACAERRLVPAIEKAPAGAIIIADGFSCREQIRQLTDREALHTAQVLELARGQARDSTRAVERTRADLHVTRRRALRAIGALALGVACVSVLRLALRSAVRAS